MDLFTFSPRSYLLLKHTNPEPDLEREAVVMETAANALCKWHRPSPGEKDFTCTALKGNGTRESQDRYGRMPWHLTTTAFLIKGQHGHMLALGKAVLKYCGILNNRLQAQNAS